MAANKTHSYLQSKLSLAIGSSNHIQFLKDRGGYRQVDFIRYLEDVRYRAKEEGNDAIEALANSQLTYFTELPDDSHLEHIVGKEHVKAVVGLLEKMHSGEDFAAEWSGVNQLTPLQDAFDDLNKAKLSDKNAKKSRELSKEISALVGAASDVTKEKLNAIAVSVISFCSDLASSAADRCNTAVHTFISKMSAIFSRVGGFFKSLLSRKSEPEIMAAKPPNEKPTFDAKSEGPAVNPDLSKVDYHNHPTLGID